MESQSHEGRSDRPMNVMVAKAALLATVMGIGACVRHRRHDSRHAEAHGHEGSQDHGGCRGPHCGGRGHREAPDHGEGLGHGPARRRRGPVQILEKRFASGEIDEEEYRRRRDVLREEA